MKENSLPSEKKSIFQNPFIFTLAAVFVTALWGSAFPMVKLGYELFEVSVTGDKLLFAGLRFTFAGLILLIVSMLSKDENGKISGFKAIKTEPSAWKTVILMALVQISGNYIFYYIGLSNTAGSIASIINSGDTFLAVLLASLFFKNDKLTTLKAVGVFVGFMGIIAVNLGNSGGGFSLTGEGFIIISCLFSTFGIFINKKVAQKVMPIVATGCFLFIGGAVIAVLAILLGGKINLLNVKADLVLLWLCFVSAMAFLIWSTLLKYNDVSKTGVFKLLIPVFGNILSALILGESIFSVTRLIAAVCVCAGIALVNIKIPQKGKNEAS